MTDRAGGGEAGRTRPSGRAEEYDDAFRTRELAGADVHGEAAFIASLGASPILDAGCGTGRVAIELARRGLPVTGVDVDGEMLGAARRKAPHLEWIEADLAALELDGPGGDPRRFGAVVMAGNVMIFLRPGTEALVVARLARHLAPRGLLVAGFQLRPGGLSVAEHETHAAAAGLRPLELWGGWGREPWPGAGDYVVAVHQAP